MSSNASIDKNKPLLYMKEFRLLQDPYDNGLADEPFTMERFRKRLQIVIVR